MEPMKEVGPWNMPDPKRMTAVVPYKDRGFMLLDSNGAQIVQHPPQMPRRPRFINLSGVRQPLDSNKYELEFLSEGGWWCFGLAFLILACGSAYYTLEFLSCEHNSWLVCVLGWL